MATAHQYPEYGYGNGYHHMGGGQYNFNGSLPSSSTYSNNNNNHHYSNWNQYYHQYQHQINGPSYHPHQDPHTNEHFRQNRFISPYTPPCEQYQSLTVDSSNYDDLKKIDKSSKLSTTNNVTIDGGNYSMESSPALETDKPPPPDKQKRRKTEDSPALRALLTNPAKKLKYSPTYYFNGKTSPVTSTISSKSTDNPSKLSPSIQDPYQWNMTCYNPPYAAQSHQNYNFAQFHQNSAILSPNKTEDSVDYLDYAMKKDTIENPLTKKDGFESELLQVPPSMQPAMTSKISQKLKSNQNSSPITASPMSNYVDSISTPPLSPVDEQHVNQIRKNVMSSPSSSPDKGYLWIQNGNECKYLPRLKIWRKRVFCTNIKFHNFFLFHNKKKSE